MRKRYTAADREHFLAELARSGETPRAVAERIGVDVSTAYRWRRASGAPFKPRKRKQPAFARLMPKTSKEATGALVVQVGAAKIRVEPDFDAALLRAVVSALGASSR